MQNKKFDWLSHLEEIPSRIYVIMAVIAMALNTVLCVFVKLDAAVCGIVCISAYGVASLIVYIFVQRKLNLYRLESNASETQTKSVIYSFKNQLSIPYAVVNENGKILTVNSAFSRVTDFKGSVFNKDIEEICSINLKKLIENARSEEISDDDGSFEPSVPLCEVKDAETAVFGNCKFRTECYSIPSKGKMYYMLVFIDITELSELNQRYRNHHAAIGYIVIDNIEEIAQYVKSNYQDETRQVGKLLGDWASQMGGILCEYENNKFLLVFTNEMLTDCIKNKFSILSGVHKIEIGDAHIPLTVSMGIATTGNTLAERGHNAMVSLDMALQRGGDQVVLKTPTGLFYFGAKTKTLQKRTKGQAKIIFGKLAALVENSSNVLIMGHRNPDFDSIGACIGMTVLIRNMFPNIDVKIVADTNCDNFKACTSRLMMLEEYKGTFIDRVAALEYNNTETLLIIIDANNMAILESPELAKNSFKKIIIDHHIKKEEFEEAPVFAYIDPSSSSTCEMISEMLEEVLPPESSFKEEANIMMAGIMLDTQNFTRTVGMRTFAAALYLQKSGADTELARTFFEEAFEDYLSQSELGSGAKMYRDRIAITSCTGSGNSHSRVLAAKAADKLLSVKGVSAAFALVLIDNTVYVSARSDGSINVQLITEKIGGGGHFDVAGAALPETTLEDAESVLLKAIDAYLDNSDDGENE